MDGDLFMSLEDLINEHCVEALDAIRSNVTLKEAKMIESGYYFPKCIENENIVITDFPIDNLITDLKHFEGIEPQKVFIFVGDYSFNSFEDKKFYYFVTYKEFQQLVTKSIFKYKI